MARLRRVVLPGHPHLITQRGQRAKPAFGDAADRALYLHALRDVARDSAVDLHAYALLPNEVRLLATPGTTSGLADLMQAVGRRYVRAFNLRYGVSGSPWEGRFRSTVVEAQRHFLGCLRFVETGVGADAAASALCTSSLAHHLGERVDPLICDHPAFWTLGNTPFEREAAYRRFTLEPPARAELASILQASLNGWVLGSAEFAAQVVEMTGRRASPVSRGRPRKVATSDEGVSG